MRLLNLVFLLGSLAACSGDRPPPETAANTARVSTSAGSVTRSAADTIGYPVIRALYLNRFAPQSPRKMRHLFAIADSTEINGFVIDMKDEFGLNYRSANPAFRKNAGGTHGMVGNVRALVDSLKAHGILAIARIVAFKDPVAAQVNPDWTIRREDSTIWRDKEGLAWVSAHNKNVWEYNLGVAEELVKLGFEEIQWDYIRFPEPYRSLPKQVFAGATLSKPDALAAFLELAQARLSKLGARNTADVFGLVTTVRGPLEVGQYWEKVSPHVDVVLPMAYPSHYPRGAFGIDRPNTEPYQVQKTALDAARTRDEKLGITKAEHVRPWIQAFSLGKPVYGAEQVKAQKQAIYDAGYKGWVLWSPGSMYDAFLPALEPKSALPR
ncbi:MAG: putative glycoside hydrolase [Gemmatimonadaceae bacterium]